MPTFDDSDAQRQPPGWEPEGLQLPLHAPPPPPDERERDDEAGEVESVGVIVIDLC